MTDGVRTVDYHTGGEPFRIVPDPPVAIPGATVAELPLARLPRATYPVVDLLTATGLVGTKSAARRTIAEGGAYVNNAKVEQEEAAVGPDEALHGRWLLVRRGRRSLAAVDLADGSAADSV